MVDFTRASANRCPSTDVSLVSATCNVKSSVTIDAIGVMPRSAYPTAHCRSNRQPPTLRSPFVNGQLALRLDLGDRLLTENEPLSIGQLGVVQEAALPTVALTVEP